MHNKKAVVVMGSPRKSGNCAALAERTAAGLADSGVSVETFNLHEMNIKPCTACDSCTESADTLCVIEDDMQTLYPKLLGADALVIATPVYWFTMSAQTKLFMDRCYALGSPPGAGLKGKAVGLLLAYGDVDPFRSGAVNALRTFQDAFAYIGAEIKGMAYGSCMEPGDARKNRSLMQEAYDLGKALL
jgi:multimeric flavodoxin WrbA